MCRRPCWPTFDVALSADEQQRYLYSGSGNLTASCGLFLGQAAPPCPEAVYVLDRETGENYGRLIDNGRGDGPGQFQDLHSLATGSDGAIYVSEITGQRAQRFVPAQPPQSTGGDDQSEAAPADDALHEQRAPLPSTGADRAIIVLGLLALAAAIIGSRRRTTTF